MSTLGLGSLTAVMALALGAGCFERPSRVAGAEASPVGAASSSAPASEASHTLQGRHTTLGPRVELDDVEGVDRSVANAAFQSTTVAMKECLAGSGGAVRIRVVHENGSTKMHVEDSSSIDGATRDCVLEALSTVEIPDAASDASPSNKPSGFSSLVTVGW